MGRWECWQPFPSWWSRYQGCPSSVSFSGQEEGGGKRGKGPGEERYEGGRKERDSKEEGRREIKGGEDERGRKGRERKEEDGYEGGRRGRDRKGEGRMEIKEGG